MNYTVTGFNNFCRVFELPKSYPKDYCFGGGIDVTFKMVDWFNPIGELPQWGISEQKYNELVKNGELLKKASHEVLIDSDTLQERLTKFLLQKNYIQDETDYIVVCNFGFSFMFKRYKEGKG